MFEGVKTADDFVAYNGIIVTIPFGDTYYGCELDVTNNGVLRVTHNIVDLSSLSWTYNSNPDNLRWIVGGQLNEKVTSTTVVPNWLLCENYPSVSLSDQNADTSLISFAIYNYSFYCRNGSSTIPPSGSVLIKLATPIEIQLTPQQIEQLLGENNVFADCGDINELKYLKRHMYYGR